MLAVTGLTPGAGGANGTGELTFYPQAGILWQDLYPGNFVDLDSGPGIRDFECGTQTYDGHTGTDIVIRSFRETDIGVPVFAALAGRVLSVQDGEYDRHFGPTVAQFDNHVVTPMCWCESTNPGRTTAAPRSTRARGTGLGTWPTGPSHVIRPASMTMAVGPGRGGSPA